jgi:hypothetical protein
MAVWDWSHGNVLAGTSVTVTVRTAPCQPVTVKLLVNGVLADEDTVDQPPDSCRVTVPPGSVGQPFEIVISCGGQSTSSTGTVG